MKRFSNFSFKQKLASVFFCGRNSSDGFEFCAYNLHI